MLTKKLRLPETLAFAAVRVAYVEARPMTGSNARDKMCVMTLAEAMSARLPTKAPHPQTVV